MKKELTESLTDVVTLNTKISKSGGWSKNALRPTRVDGQDINAGKAGNRANNAFTGIGGTKGYHDTNRATLQRVTKDEKITYKNKKNFREVKNGYGKVVRQGKPIIVKKVKTEATNIDLKKIPMNKSAELHKILGGI